LRFLLDENFPIALEQRMAEAGIDVEHVITSGRRGMPDAAIRRRLAADPDLVLLTQDEEFLEEPGDARGKIVVSRVPQRLPLETRLLVWMGAVRDFLAKPRPERLFEVFENGEIAAWKEYPLR
jgi:hypothetical protein